jgi:predicted nucleotide-binding protein
MLNIGADESIAPKDKIAAQGGLRTGFVLAEWIRKEFPKVFFIAYSNSTEKEVIDWFRKNGGGFVSKIGHSPSDMVKYICKAFKMTPAGSPICFIVHGHDEKLKLQLKNYLQNTLHFSEPIILHEEPSLGRTIIEKFEDVSKDADLAFILLTPDDIVYNSSATNEEKRRCRQNVIFEMGYFLAKLGRKGGRVILLYKGEIELPSDISGLIYIDISNGIEVAGEKIRIEIADFLPK